MCICDGIRPCREIVSLRPDLIELAILREGTSFDVKFPSEPAILDSAEFEKISKTVTSQGILLLVRRPEKTPDDAPLKSPFALVLDKIGDPGNFGTIVRTARAVGLKEIWITRGCADPYSDKSIRAASAAQFSVDVRESESLESLLALLKGKGMNTVYRTSPAAGHSVFTEPGLFDSSAIILGSEGSGVGSVEGAVDLNIPMPGDAESLNVAQAATVILFEHVRRTSAV